MPEPSGNTDKAQVPKKRGGRLWKKGQSGNPSGRPKIPDSVIEAARAHTLPAIATLAEVMNNKNEKGAARVSAASTLLDRGWGRAPINLDVPEGLKAGQLVIVGIPVA